MPGYSHQEQANSLNDLSPQSAAVLVIDELGSLEQSPLRDALLAPTLATASLCEAARAASVPVIFANDAHIPGLDKELLLWGDHNLAGDENSKPSPELNEQPTDFTIQKRRYSAFFQTDLRLLLDELGVNTLILCGFDTNICVVHTAVDAFYNNYNIVVVPDATASFLVGSHEEGLAYMQKCYGALLAESQDVIAFLKK